jgi:hypothetical protein
MHAHSSVLFAGILLARCAAHQAEPVAPPSPPLTGHFVLTGRVCTGIRTVVPSLTEWLDLKDGRGSWNKEVPGCRRKLLDVRIIPIPDGSLLTEEESPVECEPKACEVMVPSFLDGRPGRTRVECPPRRREQYVYSLADTRLILRDGTCTLEFTRKQV